MKTLRYYLCLIALLSSVLTAGAKNRVKVATIGGSGVMVDGTTGDSEQQMVEKIIQYWNKQLEKVLYYKPDLIVLAEACDRPSGLTIEQELKYYTTRGVQVKDYFASVARQNQCYIAFGTKCKQDDVWRNSCIVLDRQGNQAGIYHKNYPTIQEMQYITPSDEIGLIECDFGTVACVICFDLNFDEFRDRYAVLKPDIILFPSMYHGGLEQSKWAYSCRSYFVCAHGFLNAPSEIRNPLGEVIATSTNYYNYAVTTVNLDYKLVHLDNNWDNLVNLKKKYGDDVIITDPGRIGAVLITSEHPDITADQMTSEFNIQLLDDYFEESRIYRLKQLEK